MISTLTKTYQLTHAIWVCQMLCRMLKVTKKSFTFEFQKCFHSTLYGNTNKFQVLYHVYPHQYSMLSYIMCSIQIHNNFQLAFDIPLSFFFIYFKIPPHTFNFFPHNIIRIYIPKNKRKQNEKLVYFAIL